MSYRQKYTKPICWGMIGCGNVTEVKSAPAYQIVEGFELLAVMRRDVEKLEDYANRHKIKTCYTNADDLINDPNIDAVYIATPPDSHLQFGLKVAEAGKPCCVEKPLAPNYTESLAISEAFKNKNIPLFVAYYRRSLPRFVQVKKWLESGLIGKIRHINWHLHKAPNKIDLSREYNWRTDPIVAHGGYFDDLASHGLDLFTFLLGDIIEANGISVNQQQLYAAIDAVTGSWIHKNGITGSGNWNFGSFTNSDKVQIYGSNGKIEFSIFKEEPIKLDSPNQQKEIFIENPKHIQLFHVENMRNYLLDRNPEHPSTGHSAAHTSWVMDKILGKEV